MRDLVERPVLRDALGLGQLVLDDLRRALLGFGLGTSSAFSASAIWRSQFEDLQRLLAGDLEFALLALAVDAGLLERQFERDLLALGRLARLQLGLVEGPAAGDLAALRLFLVLDALLGDGALLRRGAPSRSTSRAVSCACSASWSRSARSLGKSARWAARRDLDLALLLEPGVFGLAVDLEDLASGRRGSGCGCRPACAARSRCASCAGVSIASVSWVRPSASKALEGSKNSRLVWSRSTIATLSSSSPLAASASGASSRTCCGVVAALLVHFLQRHLRGDRAQRGGELAFQQLAQCRLPASAPAQRLRGGGDRLACWPRRARRTRRRYRPACGSW